MVKHPTFDFDSGHDLKLCEIEPHIRLHADSMEITWDSLSLSRRPPPARAFSQNEKINIKKKLGGAWVAQSVKHWTLAQVMISWFTSSSPVQGSVLTGGSLEPASDSVSPSLSLCPSPACALSVSLSLKNKQTKHKVAQTSDVSYDYQTSKLAVTIFTCPNPRKSLVP